MPYDSYKRADKDQTDAAKTTQKPDKLTLGGRDKETGETYSGNPPPQKPAKKVMPRTHMETIASAIFGR